MFKIVVMAIEDHTLSTVDNEADNDGKMYEWKSELNKT
jgi:hypothetical protein